DAAHLLLDQVRQTPAPDTVHVGGLTAENVDTKDALFERVPLAVAVIVLSLTDWTFGAPTFSWIGLANFKELWGDRVFWQSLRNTLLFVAFYGADVGVSWPRRCHAHCDALPQGA
ncbi:MAG: sugar ABC transporter permease, partial [Gammaproteobacteria bacterium]|nr:sugar ABC transporter permease [Gammaproteobacteria bacterium]